jgi:hypothetical protein
MRKQFGELLLTTRIVHGSQGKWNICFLRAQETLKNRESFQLLVSGLPARFVAIAVSRCCSGAVPSAASTWTGGGAAGMAAVVSSVSAKFCDSSYPFVIELCIALGHCDTWTLSPVCAVCIREIFLSLT